MILSERFIAPSPAGYCKIFTAPPVSFNGIEPNTTGYTSDGSRQEVLIDGDIGPTQSVDLSDPVQVQKFFAWHKDNDSVALEFTGNLRDVSYVEVYILS